MANEKYTADQMIDALKYAQGMVTHAADRLGCSYNTMVKYIEKYPTVRAAYKQLQERTLDNVELRLLKAVNNDDLTAIIFFLKTQGKRRGYTERIDHTIFTADQLRKFEQLAERLNKTTPELFEEMVNVLGAELSADVETGSAHISADASGGK